MKRHALLAGLLVFGATALFAQSRFEAAGARHPGDSTTAVKQSAALHDAVMAELNRVHFSDARLQWGAEDTATFHVSSNSPYASSENPDTLYLFLHVNKLRGDETLCLPMQRTSDTTLSAHFVLPDSVKTLMPEIYTVNTLIWPLGRNYIRNYSNREGVPVHAPDKGEHIASLAAYDSVLQFYFPANPGDYSHITNAFASLQLCALNKTFNVSNDVLQKELYATIKSVQSMPRNSPGKYLALATLYSQYLIYDTTHRKGTKAEIDSLVNENLQKASLGNEYDRIFDNDFYWDRIRFGYAQWRVLTPLVERFPNTVMSKSWLNVEFTDPHADTIALDSVVMAGENAVNTKFLKSIALKYDTPSSPKYNPAEALAWLGRAERNIRTHAGFYNGADIDGTTTDNLPDVLYCEAIALIHAGMPDSAIATANEALLYATEQQDKIDLQIALGIAYMSKSEKENAERHCCSALMMTDRFQPDMISELYASYKLDGESEEEYARRLMASYGKDLPSPFAFDFTTIDGVRGSTAALNGKVVFLDFWELGCPPCEREKESINALADSFKDSSGVAFLSISINSAESVKKYAEKMPFHCPVIADPERLIFTKFGVNSYPTHIILDKHGNIFPISGGGFRWQIEQLLAGEGYFR